MSKTRLEAFSDGVMAILITIMVLELHVPQGTDFNALLALLPEVGIYALSFAFLGIYWNNHHHMLHATERINGAVLLANLHLLFWLSLIPFGTRWMGETGVASLPTATYGLVLLLSAIAYTILLRVILACQPSGSRLAQAVGNDLKGNLSVACYVVAIPLAFVNPRIGLAIFALVALMWLVPDPRIESRLNRAQPSDQITDH
jgi:uncharacterized membrane protein